MDQLQKNDKTGFKLLESNITTLDENLASKLVYLLKSEAEPEREAKYTELFSIKDDMRYHFMFAADANEFNSYQPTFKKMINSIKLTGPIGIFR